MTYQDVLMGTPEGVIPYPDVPAGFGYRRLAHQERILQGDEYLHKESWGLKESWEPVAFGWSSAATWPATRVEPGHVPLRRKL